MPLWMPLNFRHPLFNMSIRVQVNFQYEKTRRAVGASVSGDL